MGNEAEFLKNIEGAAKGPKTDYLVFACVAGMDKLIAETTIGPNSDAAATSVALWLAAKAKLKQYPHTDAEIAKAELFLEVKPDVKAEIEAAVKDMQTGGADMVFVDQVRWDMLMGVPGYTAIPIGASDAEITYKGLRIRCSATN